MGIWNLLKEVGNKVLPIVKPIAGMAVTATLSYMGSTVFIRNDQSS